MENNGTQENTSIHKRLRACLSLLQTCTGIDIYTGPSSLSSSSTSLLSSAASSSSSFSSEASSLLIILLRHTESMLQEYRQGLDVRLVHEIVNQTHIRNYTDIVCGLSSSASSCSSSVYPTTIGLIGWIERDIRNLHYNSSIPSLIFHDGQVRIPLVGTTALHPRYLNGFVFLRHWAIQPLPSTLTSSPHSSVSTHTNTTVMANNYYLTADSIIPLLTIYDLLSIMIQHNYTLPLNLPSTTRASLIGTVVTLSKVFLLKKPDTYGFIAEVLIGDHFISSSRLYTGDSTMDNPVPNNRKVFILFEGTSFYHVHPLLQVHEVYLFTYLAKRTIQIGDTSLSMYIAQMDNTIQTGFTVSSLSTYPSTSIRTTHTDHSHNDTSLLQRLGESGTRILSPIFDKEIMNTIYTNHTALMNTDIVPYASSFATSVSALHPSPHNHPFVSLQGKIVCITESSLILCHDHYTSTNVPSSSYMFTQIFLRRGPWITPSYVPSHSRVHEQFPALLVPLSGFMKPGTVVRVHNVYPLDTTNDRFSNVNENKHSLSGDTLVPSTSLFPRSYCVYPHTTMHIHSIATERIDIDNFGLITVYPSSRNPVPTIASAVLYPYPLSLTAHICLRYSTKIIAGSWGERSIQSTNDNFNGTMQQHPNQSTVPSSVHTITWSSIANEVFKSLPLPRYNDASLTVRNQHPILDFIHPSTVYLGDDSRTSSLPLLIVTPTSIGTVSLSLAVVLRNLLQDISSPLNTLHQPWNVLYENDLSQRCRLLDQTVDRIRTTIGKGLDNYFSKDDDATRNKHKYTDIDAVYSQDSASVIIPGYYFVPVIMKESLVASSYPTLVGQLQPVTESGTTELYDHYTAIPILNTTDTDIINDQLFIQSSPFHVRIDMIRVPYLVSQSNETMVPTLDPIPRKIQDFSIFASLPCTSIDEYLHDCLPTVFQYFGEQCRNFCRPGWNTVPLDRSSDSNHADNSGIVWLYRYRVRLEFDKCSKPVIRPTFTSIGKEPMNPVMIVPLSSPRVRINSTNQYEITLDCYIPSLHGDTANDIPKSVTTCAVYSNHGLPYGYHLLSSLGFPLQLMEGKLCMDAHGKINIESVRGCKLVRDTPALSRMMDLSFLKLIPVTVSSTISYLRTILTVRACLHSIGEVFTGDEPSAFWKSSSLKSVLGLTNAEENGHNLTDSTSPVYRNPPSFALVGRILAIKVDPPEEKSYNTYTNSVPYDTSLSSVDNRPSMTSSWIGWSKPDTKLTILLGHVPFDTDPLTEDKPKFGSATVQPSLHDTVSLYFRPQNTDYGIILPSEFGAGSVVLFTEVQRVYGRSHRIYCKCDNGSVTILKTVEQYQRLRSLYTIIDPCTASSAPSNVPKFPLYQLLSDSSTNRSVVHCQGTLKKVLWFACQWICPFTGTGLVPVPRGIIDTISPSTHSADTSKLCVYTIGNYLMVKKNDLARIHERPSTSLSKSSTEYTLPQVFLPSSDRASSVSSIDRVTLIPGGSSMDRNPAPGFTLQQYIKQYQKCSVAAQQHYPFELCNQSVFKMETSFLLDDGTGEVKGHIGDVYPFPDAKQYLSVIPALGTTASLLDFTGRQLQHWQHTTSIFGKLEISTQISSMNFRQPERGMMNDYSDGEDEKYYGGLPYLVRQGKPDPSKADTLKRSKDDEKSTDEVYDPFEETLHDDILYWRNIKRKRLKDVRKVRTKVGKENDTIRNPPFLFATDNTLVIATDHSIDPVKHRRYEETFTEWTSKENDTSTKKFNKVPSKGLVSTQLYERLKRYHQGLTEDNSSSASFEDTGPTELSTGSTKPIIDTVPSHLQIQYFTAVEAATRLRKIILTRSCRNLRTYEFTCQLVYPAEFQPKTTTNRSNDEEVGNVSASSTSSNVSKFSRELQWRRDSTVRSYSPQLANTYASLLENGKAFLQSVYFTTPSNTVVTKRKECTVLLPSVPTTLPIPPPLTLVRTITIGKDDFQSKAIPKVHLRIVALSAGCSVDDRNQE